jgi:hypothetical protein
MRPATAIFDVVHIDDGWPAIIANHSRPDSAGFAGAAGLLHESRGR